ncbi:EAL domain-containing protein [Hankyongella ginsenosidimutans]|uniref:EAL domain-containing protein n=1 Tax=Hankyongella ginsenosidimutans TaxID=1763828 RepID=A0A4D7C831_9SPHN|nr:GGDEF domain-containing phosphodiesterase [Hankyongella ginsenosidimutans]QCI80390.1 EAL domain-containing protein [Hankyongella ginsenosidimutans]
MQAIRWRGWAGTNSPSCSRTCSRSPPRETAERIHRELSNPIRIGGEELYVSLSIGAASSLSGEYFAENLIQDADFAMNRAKALGRGCTEIYQNAEHLEARAQFRLETDLRHAVWRRELTLNYQPLIDLKTGRPHSFEALARWHHPTRGFVSPVEFIPVAESTGLIVELGRWALDEACRTLAQWRSDGVAPDDLRVAVNVSALQFARDDLVAVVLNALERYDLPGRCLELEITESAIAEHPQKAVDVLNQLKAQDVIIAMDDFGTGYSSLGALQQLPIDILKIDRSFIAGMLELEESHKLVCTVLSLASHLGKATVAEGIERFDQAVALRDLGCTLGQGYAFSRPVDNAHAAEFLRRTAAQAIAF